MDMLLGLTIGILIGLVGGILVGRRNTKKVESVLAKAKAELEEIRKKI